MSAKHYSFTVPLFPVQSLETVKFNDLKKLKSGNLSYNLKFISQSSLLHLALELK